ncbi:MAG: type I-E CRISPR-associated protein Cse1/CasA [Deltaproteobacteria bacterium]|nr:type I-E CRISPR-associated protein Cse1/CasA [Deltaproteobacteria bacterium]
MATEHPVRFNALTDPWLPLVQADGSTVWASFVEVLAGEKDGVDLDYPRDDFRVFARLLLSALVQALFPAKDKAELVQRLAHPLKRVEIEKRISAVLESFDLFGPKPFLQIVPPAKLPDGGAAPFVFPAEDLFSSPVPIDAISIPIALIVVFIEQTFAGGAGRGYGAGPAGQPGALTLIDAGSVRSSAWANTLVTETVAAKYAKEAPVPWSNEKRTGLRRASVGLVTGLFFQPRGTWLIPAEPGACSFSGIVGPRVRRAPLLPKSDLAKKSAGGEDLWQHPCAPLAVNSQGIGAIRLSAEQPAWTGLAQLLQPVSKGKTKKEHPSEGPALVLQQWKTLGWRGARSVPRLIVLDFDRDKANVKRRFFESYPLSNILVSNPELLELMRAIVDDAQAVQRRLAKALVVAHDDQRRGGFALREAETSFWRDSEPAFFAWLASAASLDAWTDEAALRVQTLAAAMKAHVRRAALGIFDAHVEISEFDPAKAKRIAAQRRALRSDLYPSTQASPARAVTTGESHDHAS